MKWLVGVALLALAGCAATPRTDGFDPPALDPQRLPGHWTASGRIAIAAGEQGGSAQFSWRQAEQSSRISLRGPLGVGALEVESDGTQLSVSEAEGRQLDADAARALLAQRLGIDLPLAELRYWMLGLPAPGLEANVHDAAQPPRRTIEQSGWRIEYESFQPFDAYAVPVRFSAASGAVRLRMIVDRWDHGAAGAAVTP